MSFDDMLDFDVGEYEGLIELLISNYSEQDDLINAKDFSHAFPKKGYMSKEEFLMKICNCEKVIGLTEGNSKKVKIVFDETKVEKPFEEYLKQYNYENLYVPEEDRVYSNIDFLNAHKNKKGSR